MAEIPYLQEQVLCRVVDGKQEEIKREFSITISNLDSHKSMLLNKLSSMLVEVIQKSMKNGPPAHYSQPFDKNANKGPSDYIDKISKSMNNLNKAILAFLNDECRKIIFNGVFPNFIDEIGELVNGLNEESFEWFKHDLKFLEKDTSDLASGVSTGVAFMNRIKELQDATIEDLVYMEEEEDEDENE